MLCTTVNFISINLLTLLLFIIVVHTSTVQKKGLINMSSYTQMPNDAILNTIISQYTSIRSGTKEYYLIANYGRQLPMFIKCINYYLNQKNIGLYINNTLF